jgi:hypothetical protein
MEADQYNYRQLRAWQMFTVSKITRQKREPTKSNVLVLSLKQ